MTRTFNRNVPAIFMVFLMIFTMVFSSIAAIPMASADVSQVMTVSSGSGTPGQIPQLNITMNDGVGLSAAQFTVNYDSNQFTIDEADGDFDGLADSIVPGSGNNLGSPPTVGFFNGHANFVMNRAGGVAIPPGAAGVTVNVLGIKFTVKAGAINGTYPITITNLQVFDYDGNQVVIGAPINGSITVTGGAAAPSSAKAITAFSFANPAVTGTVNEAAKTIAVTVPYGTDVTNLTPTIAVSPNATVNPLSGTAQNFTNPVTYTVTAQDTTTQDYVVTVTVAPPSDNNYLSNLRINNASNNALISMSPTFSMLTPTYTATVPYTTTAVTVTPNIVNANATATVNGTPVADNVASGAINLPNTGATVNTITVVVTAQDSTTRNYTINVTRTAPSSAKAITSFRFTTPAATGVINEAAKTIALTVPYGTNVVHLTPTITVSPNATVSPASGVEQDFTSPVTYTVTAQDSTTQAYVVTVNITPPSSNNNLSALLLRNGTTVINLDPQFAAATTAYDASVGNAVNSVTVIPTVADSTAAVTVNGTAVTSGTVSGAINLPNTGTTVNTITIVVTAQNSSTKTYTIQVKRAVLETPGATDTVVVDPAEPVTINAAQGATLDVDETQPLPLIEVSTVDPTLGTIQISIPEGTTVTGGPGWSGDITLPTVYATNSVTVAGASSVSAVIEVGDGNNQLTFSNAVRIVIPGMAGKTVGFIRGGVLTEITRTISLDNQTTADLQIPAAGDGYIDVGADKVVWTKHFTMFVAYTKATGGTGSTGSGGSGGGSTTFNGTLIDAEDGGTVSSSSLGVKVVIPADAMDDSFKIKVELASSTGLQLPDNCEIVGNVVEITKNVAGYFEKAITITLNFDKSKVDLSKVTLSLCYYDTFTNKWVELKNVKVDPAAGTVSGEVDHLTKFAIISTGEEVKPPVTPPVQNTITDISGHWAAANITNLINSGAIAGYLDNTFRPDASITRAEFASILVKAFNLAQKDGKVFNDTAAHWAKASIATAQAYGIISGYSDSKFGPDDKITREQMAVMIVKAAQLTQATSDKNFSDKAKVSSWAREAVNTAVANGIISGYPDNTFKPAGATTRAEAVTVIVKAMK